MGEQERFAIEIVKSHCLGGGRGDVYEGTVLSVPQDLTAVEARSKITMGYAVEADSTAAGRGDRESEVSAPGAVKTRDPALEKRDPEVTRPRKLPKPKPGGKGAKTRRRK